MSAVGDDHVQRLVRERQKETKRAELEKVRADAAEAKLEELRAACAAMRQVLEFQVENYPCPCMCGQPCVYSHAGLEWCVSKKAQRVLVSTDSGRGWSSPFDVANVRRGLVDDLRARGWSVAVHNDYRQGGEARTFWLLTHPDGRWAKGEGRTDAEALEKIRAYLPTWADVIPPPTSRAR
jgi:hypothetical protein